MSENSFNTNLQDRKPVNINISFNISRKQVTQNINASEHQTSLNHKNIPDQDIDLKSKNHFYRQPKTPQLTYTDRNNLSKDFQFVRPTQELKRKKKIKRSSGDYTADKITHFPIYQNQLQKSVPGHKRGYTTSFINKSTSIAGTKKKKTSTKTDQLQKQNRTVFLNENTKNQSKPSNQSNPSKSLKGLINKMINSELSKRSLPLVVNKAKYNQSTSLTSRKMTTSKQTKKRSSKSQMMTKQKVTSVDKSYSDPIVEEQHHQQSINKSLLLQKFGNFKSIENSLLICEAQKIQEQQQQLAYAQSKRISSSKKRIIIKTDQSIQCIGEIHNFERNKYKDEFFDNQNSDDEIQIKKNNKTHNIIQTYINLLEQNYVQIHKQGQNERLSQRQKQRLSERRRRQIPADIQANRNQVIYDQNYLNSSDLQKVDDLLQSPISKKYQNNKISNSIKKQIMKIQEIQNHSLENSINCVDKNNKNIQYINSLKQQTGYNNQKTVRQVVQKEQKQFQCKQQNKSSNKKQLSKIQNQNVDFRQYVSSQIGRQSLSSSKNTNQQRIRVSELKRQQIQKWSYLLDYIKSNISKQVSTQDVLQHVYDYLSQAKIDLIKQGSNLVNSGIINSDKINIYDKINNSDKNKLILDDQFTNHLSSQFQKSQNLVQQHQFQQDNQFQQEHYNDQMQINYNEFNKKQRLKSQEQQILDQEVNSFKDQYQSQDNDEDIKFMNLQTIESALKNRLKILNQKKQKQLHKLEEDIQQDKITLNLYEQQKASIQKWFKNQTNQISSVKKNIWKGYNQAKSILDKSYIGAKFEESYKIKGNLKRNNGQKKLALQKSADKKGKRMMKCLSESYLNKKKIDYKQFIQAQQRKIQQQNDSRPLRRQKYVHEDSQEQDLEDSNIYEYHQSDQQIQGWGKQFKTQSGQKQESRSNGKKQIEKTIQADSAEKQMQKISKKVKQLKQQHLDTLNSQQITQKTNQKKQIKSSNSQKLSQDQNKNELPTYSSKTQAVRSPSSNEFSPTMIQYQQISKQLESQSENQQTSQHSFNYYPRSQQSQNQPYQYEEQKSLEQLSANKNINQEQKSLQTPKKPVQKSVSLTPPNLRQEDYPQIQPTTLQLSPVKNKQQTKMMQKLKYLTDDDLQDIFQFLFLDLCIELYQEPCSDNKLMISVNNFISKQLQMSKRKKGVKTNLTVIKDYLKRFCGYILRTNKKVLANVNIPMGPTATEMLRYMHENDVQDEPLDDGDGTVTLIVPISIFDIFERSLLPTLQFDKYYDNEQKQQERVNFLKNILHIHNKALFDALNEFLDQQRPFGIWGKPFPWKKSSSFAHMFTEIEHEQKLKKSAQKVVQACSYVCGLLVDKQESLIGNAKVSEAYIEQIREDRISRMLANDMIENEERWVFYDDEETQVLVEIANYTYNKMLIEFIGQFTLIRQMKLANNSIEN